MSRHIKGLEMKRMLMAAATSVSMTLAAAPAMAQCDAGETVLKFSLVTNLQGHPKGEAALALAEAVNTQFDGQLCMEVFGNSELYDDDAVFDALLANEVHVAAPSASKFGQFSAELQLFDVPFVFDSALHVLEFLETEAAAQMLSTVEDDGFTVLGFWSNGMYQMSGSRPLRVPTDAAGLNFRVQALSPSIVSLLDAMGATGERMAFSKVYGALESGQVQGQYNTWSNIQGKEFYLHQAAITETNFAYLGYPVVMATAFLDQLEPAVREEFLATFSLITHERNRFAFEINQQRRQDILDDDGIIIRLSENELNTWRTALAPIVDQFRRDVNADLIDAAIAANAAADPF